MKKILIILFLLFPTIAFAQSQRNPCWTTNKSNCIPVGPIGFTGVGPLPVGGNATAAAPTFTEGQLGGLSFDLSGNLRIGGSFTPSSQYPVGATAITVSNTGTTAATAATLAGTSGKTTYLCSYSIRANATAAATVTNTIAGVITATMSHIMWVAPLASGLGVDEQIFSPCIPASAANTGIVITSGAPGTGGNVSVTGTGYQL